MIHQYKLNGYNIVLDVFSGSVHCVDDLAYDVIEMYENSDKDNIIKAMLEKYKDNPEITAEEISDCYDDVTELKDNGKLFTADKYEDLAFDFKKRNTVIKALCLHIAHTCNLNCEYCFASQGKYHGDRALMSFEVGKRAIDFLIENSGSRVNLEVDFFGGEPLMNFDVVKQIVAYARSIEKEKNKNFRFTLTTNGMLVDDDVIEFANKECHNVVLSLDGRKEVHDHLRKTVSGKGSYDIIVPKFRNLLKSVVTKVIMCVVLIHITILILQMIFSIWQTLALQSFQWSLLFAHRKTRMRLHTMIYLFFLSSTRYLQRKCLSVKRGQTAYFLSLYD